MSEPEDRLENFIRKGLGQPAFAFREEDWALMEAKLSVVPVKVSLWSRLRWWLLGGVLFFIAFFSGWIMKGWLDGSSSKINTEITATQDAEGSSLKSNQPSLSQREDPKKDALVEGNPSNKTESPSSIDQNNIGENTSVPIARIPDEQTATTSVSNTDSYRGDSSIVRLNSYPWSLESIQSTALQRKISSFKNSDSSEPPKHDDRESRKPYHLAIGLMVSPDFTGTTIKKGFESMGQTFGLGAEFYTSPKFRVKMAVIQSEKIYSADKGEYTIPTGYGYSNPQPEKTDAICAVLEVPLFIQYNLWNEGRNSIWLSNGLSSYWMQREEYQYTYLVSGTSPENIVLEKENKHLFSVVSLGVTYERQLSKQLSLELEPYLKIPLGGVGYGKVTLYTTGAYFSFKYHLRR